MSEHALSRLARLRRPTAAIGWVAGLYLLSAAPLSTLLLGEGWRRPVDALTAWLVAFAVLALPLVPVAAALAARMERAATGVRHPQRAGWVGVALGVLLAAHWMPALWWTPAYLLWGLGSSYARERMLVGALASGLAWVGVVAGVGIARRTGRMLRQRRWDRSVPDRPRRLPRIPTPWLGALAYAVALAPLGAGVAAMAVDEGAAALVASGWGAVGLVLCGLAAAWGAWAATGLERARDPGSVGGAFGPVALELFGAAWAGHWAPFWVVAAAPFWGRYDHDAQLVASTVASALIAAGVASWSYGRAARLGSVPRAAVAG